VGHRVEEYHNFVTKIPVTKFYAFSDHSCGVPASLFHSNNSRIGVPARVWSWILRPSVPVLHVDPLTVHMLGFPITSCVVLVVVACPKTMLLACYGVICRQPVYLLRQHLAWRSPQ
jgi:hypothetical protein